MNSFLKLMKNRRRCLGLERGVVSRMQSFVAEGSRGSAGVHMHHAAKPANADTRVTHRCTASFTRVLCIYTITL